MEVRLRRELKRTAPENANPIPRIWMGARKIPNTTGSFSLVPSLQQGHRGSKPVMLVPVWLTPDISANESEDRSLV